MRVPFIDLGRQHGPMKQELIKAFERVLDSNKFVLSDEVKQFEDKVASYVGVEHAVGVSNGTNALLLSLRALGISNGDEVITTPFTFVATAEVIALAGAKPVFCDIEPRTYNIDVKEIARHISPRTKAVMPVHLYGQAAGMDEIMKLAGDRHLSVIEDMAQALGAKYKGKHVGRFGDTACISFYVTKNLSALGDAGMILTKTGDLDKKLRAMRVHGASKKYHHDFLGYNDRLDAMQAAFLNFKLGHLDAWNRRRHQIATKYNDGLKDVVVTPYVESHNEPVWHQYTIRTQKRDPLQAFLKEKGVETAVHYPVPLHLQPAFRNLGYKKGDFPEAEKAAGEVISLPIQQDLTDEEVVYVVDTIRDFFKA